MILFKVVTSINSLMHGFESQCKWKLQKLLKNKSFSRSYLNFRKTKVDNLKPAV